MKKVRKNRTGICGLLLLLTLILAGCGGSGGAYTTDGYAAIAAGDYDLAITDFEAAIAENGKERMALRGLGIARMGKAQYAEAIVWRRRLAAEAFFPTGWIMTSIFIWPLPAIRTGIRRKRCVSAMPC